MHANSAGKGWFIMSKNITEKRHGTVLLVVKLDMMEDFPWAEVSTAAAIGRKQIRDHGSINPMISGASNYCAQPQEDVPGHWQDWS